MAFSSILSFALIQAVLYSTTTASTATTTTSGKTVSILFSKTSAVNSTDNYLLPLSIGSNSQLLYLTASTSSDDTFVNSPKVCTPPGNSTVVGSCVQYRGGVFGPPQSSSWKTGNAAFSWKNEEYVLFADGGVGEDVLEFSGRDGNVSVDEFKFGVVDACNMTSGFLGLGVNSTLLTRLVLEGAIASRSFGLSVGVDIQDHPDPVFDPTFDDGRGVGSDLSSGVGRRGLGLNGTVHSFPGSLILGGYDKARIDNRTATLKVPVASDGSLHLEVTDMVLRNDMVHDLLNSTRDVVIDSSTPYLYLPESLAQQLSYALEAQDGEPGVDFFYGSSADKRLGNITFTLQIPGGGSKIDIVIPPSVLYQPITALRDYIPVGNANFDHYLPVKTFKDSSTQPIILGRTFLKAAYLFVNYDKKAFQLSQLAYNPGPPNIVVATLTDLTLDSGTTVVPIGEDTTTDNPHTERPIAPIAAAVGGGAVVLAFAVAFFLWRRRQPPPTLQPLPSTVTVNHYGNELDGASTPMVNLPSRDEKQPGGPGGQNWGVWEKDGNGGYYTPHPTEQYHEMESDYVGMATSPSEAYPPRWAELPAEPVPVHMQHPALGGRSRPVSERYEMM